MSISPSSWKRLSAPVPPLRHAAPSSSSSQERSSLLARCSSTRERGGSGTGVQAGVLPGITSGERGAAVHGWGPGSRWEPSSAAELRQVRLLKVWRFCKGKGKEAAETGTGGNPQPSDSRGAEGPRRPPTLRPPHPSRKHAERLKHPARSRLVPGSGAANPHLPIHPPLPPLQWATASKPPPSRSGSAPPPPPARTCQAGQSSSAQK